jgi:protocatechuate 3,4-dioxygenase beta subunit
MRNLRIITFSLLSLVLAGSPAGTQQVIINGSPSDQPMQVPGMGPRPLKTGTARIRGRVMSSDSGSPIRRAQVRITGPEIVPKTAVTDAEGRYEFRELPGGRFVLSATKAGYVSVQYGQKRPNESGKAIELVDTQVLERADISMPRGSVIAGRVLDEFGDPVADVVVSAMGSAWSGGRRRLQSAGRMATTNDLGQFRIYGLAPGDYFVSATLRSGDPGMFEIAMAASSGVAAAPGPSASSPTSGYAPTYFPGTATAAEAQRIQLAVGQEAQGTDFALLPVRLAKIAGSVVGSDGRPVEGLMVSAVPRGGEIGLFSMGSTARTDKNGNFTLSNVTPGEYTLQTRAMQFVTSGGGDTMMFSARIGADASGLEAESGSLPVTVGGQDLANVVILTSKGATASGHVIFEGGGKPNSLTGIRVLAIAAENEAPMLGMGGSSASVKAEGTFELRGLSGVRSIRPAALPQGWMLKSVRVNGAEVTDTGVDFKPGEAVTGVEIILTSKVTDVSGTVKATNGDLVKDYTVVLFSDDPQRWTDPSSRYVHSARPDQDGRFQVKAVPPGGYYAIATDYIAQGEWADPEVLDRLKAKGTRFSLDEGEARKLELKIQ